MAFEVEPESIARSVVPAGDRGTYMVMDFGRTRTGIFIVSGGAVSFTSTVSVGGYSLTRAIAKELGLEDFILLSHGLMSVSAVIHEVGRPGKRYPENKLTKSS